MNALDTRGPKHSHGVMPVDDDDEVLFDDGYPDDYAGDGLEGPM